MAEYVVVWNGTQDAEHAKAQQRPPITRRTQGKPTSLSSRLWTYEGRSNGNRPSQSVAERAAANVMRNKAQQFEQPKRRGVDVPWDGPARFRRKQPKPAKPQPQLALGFSPTSSLLDLSPESNAASV
jgi:hypothetical protein